MDKPLPDVVVDVALECYGRLDRLQPGSEEADFAEHAVSMVLSARRAAKPQALLLNDVLRNARHSVRRSRARHLQVVEETGRLAVAGVATGATRAFVATETPEEICIARELGQTLETEACRCGRHGPRILTGLLGGRDERDDRDRGWRLREHGQPHGPSSARPSRRSRLPGSGVMATRVGIFTEAMTSLAGLERSCPFCKRARP